MVASLQSRQEQSTLRPPRGSQDLSRIRRVLTTIEQMLIEIEPSPPPCGYVLMGNEDQQQLRQLVLALLEDMDTWREYWDDRFRQKGGME